MASRTDVAWVATQFVLFALVAAGILLVRGDGPSLFLAFGGVLTLAGLLLAGSAMARLGPSVSPYPTPTEGAILVMHGPYRLVRHPIYGGVVLVAVGLSLISWSWPGLAVALGLVPFFVAKSRHEELMLTDRFEGYSDYVAATPRRLIPWVV